VQELEQTLRMPVISILKLENLIDMLEESSEYAEYLEPVLEYRKKYGAHS
jgi:orotate phosphoribosyltransferase